VHQITRKGHRSCANDQRPKYGGTFTIYDGKEDAISHGITNIKFWKDSSIKIGDWVEYPDGSISEVIRVFQRKSRKDMGLIITTRLNNFTQAQNTVISTVLPYRCYTGKPKPETITTSRLEFAEEWLLNGKSIQDACRLHLWQSTTGYGKALSPRSYKTFAYLTISLPWFDELLKTNRIMRDRYMSLVGALTACGVDEAYIADQLKKDIESANVKLHINAINNAIELLEASAAKKRIPIQASWSVEPKDPPKQIETANINSLLEESIHEHVRSERNETAGNEAVSIVGEVQGSGSPISETKRDTPIFIGASN
jgi:hypothetical protein